MWPPNPKQDAEQYPQWNSCTREVCVVGTMRTHAANRMPSVVMVPSPTAWVHAHSATESLGGPQRLPERGAAW